MGLRSEEAGRAFFSNAWTYLGKPQAERLDLMTGEEEIERWGVCHSNDSRGLFAALPGEWPPQYARYAGGGWQGQSKYAKYKSHHEDRFACRVPTP